jgi:DNA (cytosine-5)-methyltransferase 1
MQAQTYKGKLDGTRADGGARRPDALPALDLFCGAGGLTEGFRRAGVDIRLGVDSDEVACATYRLNQGGARALTADLREVSARDLLHEAGIGQAAVVLGGPSCQGFSTHGRRNGWVRPGDSRNFLYRDYARIIEELRPYCFVMENVPGLLYYDSGRFWKQIHRRFVHAGYRIHHELLLAADYGIPQLRRRLLVVGTRLSGPFLFPERTHVGALRRDHRDLWERRRLAEWPHLPPHVGVWDAISDLPPIPAGEGKERARYGAPPETELQRHLRAGSRWLYDHQASALPEGQLRQVERVPEGGAWRDIPPELLPERFTRIRRTDGTTLFGRLERAFPAYTITTQFNNVTAGCYIHPLQQRTLSAREGARIQTFPDRYRFVGSLDSKRRQIGNAVPPLLAEVVARAVVAHIGAAEQAGRSLSAGRRGHR